MDAPGDDPYEASLVRALLAVGEVRGFSVADVGAGTGCVSAELARRVGAEGRVYAIDSDSAVLDAARAADPLTDHAVIVALVQGVEALSIPEPVDLAVSRFLLLHLPDPLAALTAMAHSLRPGGYLIAAEPVTSAGRVGGLPLSFPSARSPDLGATLVSLVTRAGFDVVASFAEAPVGAGPGPVSAYLEALTEVDPGDDDVMLPPLVTVVGRRNRAGTDKSQ